MSGFSSYDDFIDALGWPGGIFSSDRWQVFGTDMHPLARTTFSGVFGSTTCFVTFDRIGLPFGAASIPVIKWGSWSPSLLSPLLPDIRPPYPPFVVIK